MKLILLIKYCIIIPTILILSLTMNILFCVVGLVQMVYNILTMDNLVQPNIRKILTHKYHDSIEFAADLFS